MIKGLTVEEAAKITDEDIDYVLEHLPGIIHRLRELSPFVPAEKA